MEDEVLSLHDPIIKAISVSILALLSVSPSGDLPQGNPPAPGVLSLQPSRSGDEVALGAKAKIEEWIAQAPTGDQEPCVSGMVLIDGDYCPEPEQVCLKWLDPPPYENLRCGEYRKPATCKVPRQYRRFCVDREEYAEGPSTPEALPMVNKSWTEAKSLCEARGARLCKETEWEFACEGEDMNPYPYGFAREPGICNIDRTDLGGMGDKLRDHRAPLAAFPECTSAFGVHDLTGNVDEWVEREGMAAPRRSSLRGGWWLPGRNRCRAATTHHDESYSGKQVGFRCCADTRS